VVWAINSLIPCHAQSQKIVRNNYELFMTVDGHQFHQIDGRKRNIFLDDRCIDSAGVKLTSFLPGSDVTDSYVYGHKFVELLGENSYKETIFRIDNSGVKSLNSFLLTPFFFTGRNIFHQTIRSNTGNNGVLYNRNFLRTDLIRWEDSRQFDVDGVLKLDSNARDELVSIYEISPTKIIVTVSLCEYGGCSNYQYIQFDISSGIGKKLILNRIEPDNEFYLIRFLENDTSSFLVEIGNYSGRPENAGFFIMDKDYNIIGQALKSHRRAIGNNYLNGKMISKNMKTPLDDLGTAIFEYNYSNLLESSLFEIYSDRTLSDEVLARANNYELDIMRNMIFAKHNYKFENEFYQAYFIRYEFYWKFQFSAFANERRPRLTNVDSLLTEVDKSNLARIQFFAAKLKK
jgi:hypothetical protein